jgi:hypothetical protein
MLPAGEKVLWQGSPDWKPLAVTRFHVRKLVVYFALILAARMAAQAADGVEIATAFRGAWPLIALSVIAVGLVTLMAWLTARTAVYTVTDKRVVMRIGIVLTLTLNLPYKRMEGAGLKLHTGPTGDIALQLLAGERVAYLHLWPHARRWHFTRPEPTLLCVPEAQAVAQTLSQAWAAACHGGEAVRPASSAGDNAAPERAPTLATR